MRSARSRLPLLETFPWRDGRLAARLFRATAPTPAAAASPLPAVLFIHGWQGAQDANDVRLAALLRNEGHTCMTFDLAGHGRSEGDANRCTLADFRSQALAAYDHLASRLAGTTAGVCICGASLGSYLALLVSAARPVRALSLRVPANYPDEIMESQPLGAYVQSAAPRAWREQRRGSEGNAALTALAAFDGPVQIVAAGQDETIPAPTLENFVAAVAQARLDFHLLAEATHVLYSRATTRAESYRLVRHWLSTLPV